MSLRWLLMFQGCFFKALQKELPGQAASPPASCAFDLILNASLRYIHAAVLVVYLGVILHCRETLVGS